LLGTLTGLVYNRAMKLKRFLTPAGLEVLAGQDDEGNDRVTFGLARPGDYWFHVHGFPGSHVVLRASDATGDADRDSIKQAAALAAWFSRMRQGGTVAVSCCRARDVRKPPGAKSGTVTIRNDKKLTVRPAVLPEAGEAE